MNSFFDEASQKIILQAKKEMFDLKHPYVGSEHLFLAILHSDLSVTKVLKSYGITYELFKKELIQIVGVGNKKNDWFLFTPLLKRILSNASLYLKEGHILITPEDLLIAIFREGDGIANRILIGMNVDLDALQEKLFNVSDGLLEPPNYEFFNQLGINMNDKAVLDTFDPVVGRDFQIMQIIQILLHKNKNNPLLIGEAGVGKTAIVEELARRISLGKVPFKLKDKIIYNIPISSLVAGTKYRGEFEEKLHKLIEEVIKQKNIILFIDEVHTLMGAGGAEGAIDASNILKPYLARGDIKIIGATTIKEYADYIAHDKAFDRRFQKIYIQEATRDEVIQILLKLRPIYEKYHQVLLKDEILNLFADLSSTCFFNGREPDKTIDFLDEVCSYVSLFRNQEEQKLSSYHQKICEIQKMKNDAIKRKKFQEAILYKKEEMELVSNYNESSFAKKDFQVIIEKEDLYKVIYQKTKFDPDIFFSRIHSCHEKVKNILFGQADILDSFFSSLKKYNYITNKESMTFLFVGKSGVGKTFLLENVVKDVFSEIPIVSVSMEEYRDKYSLSKLIGSEMNSFYSSKTYLLESVIENPFSVLILENIDEACNYVFHEIMNALSVGFIRNSKGEKIYLHKCIVFMTSKKESYNIGFSSMKKDEFYEKYDRIKHVFSFHDVTSEMIEEYLNKNLNISISKSRELMKKILEKTQWRKTGFHAVCDFLEEEAIQI